MDELILVLPAGLVAVPAYLYLRKRFAEQRAAPLWGAAWCSLVLAGAADAIGGSHIGLQAIAGSAMLGFEGLVLAGALAFTRDPRAEWRLGWLWLGAPAIGMLHLVDHQLGELLGSLIGAGLLGLSATLVWRYARRTRASAAEHGLAALFAGLALLELLGDDAGFLDASKRALLTGWLVLGFTTASFQLVSSIERANRRRMEVRHERQLLRRITNIASDSADRNRLFAQLAAELGCGAPAPLIGLWKREGALLRLLPAKSHLPVAPAMYETPLDSPLATKVISSPGPVRLGPLDGEPNLASVAQRTGIQWGLAAPIRVDGELVGVLGVVFWPSPTPERDQEEYVEGLLEAIVSVLRAAQVREKSERQAHFLEVGRSNTEALLEAVPVGILLTDGAGRVQLMNRTVAEQFGLGLPESWAGRRVQDVMLAIRSRLDPMVQPDLDAHLASLGGTDGLPNQAFELRFPEADGRVLWMSAQSVRQADGSALGRVWVTHDVTAERRIAARMQHADRMETLGTLAGGLAHDFNNQLTGILGNASLLLEELPARDPAREPLEDLERSAEHCAELTQGLLAFARQGPRADGSVDLRGFLAEFEALLGPSLGPEVGLEVRIEMGAPSAVADAAELRRVLTNLVLNARDAVGANGQIVLEARSLDAGKTLEVCVLDDGMGMDARTRRRIFDPFFTTKGRGHGTGLGLAVVYGIVEAHGGSIDVTSRPGGGARFRVCWPTTVELAPLVEHSETEAEFLESIGDATILLAEDEPGVRRMTRTALERAGYRVLEAENGDAAVRCFHARPGEVDLLLFDLSMPRCDGLSAIETIRKRAPGLPALVMSGHPDRERVWPADVPLLRKPFGPSSLLDQVGKLLARRATGEPGDLH